jgi:integrase
MASIKKLNSPKSGPAKYRVRVFGGWDPNKEVKRKDGTLGRGAKIIITETVVGEQAAKDRAVELEAMRSKGALAAPSKELLGAFLTRWLDDVKKMELRARTWDDYRGIVDRYLERAPKGSPRIGSVRLDKLTVGSFERLYTHMWKSKAEGGLGLSQRTIRYLHSVLRHALSYAVKHGDLARNPTDNATLPKKSADGAKKKANAMSKAEADRFLDAARDDRYYALWCVLLMGGLRPSEALGLARLGRRGPRRG